jgi:hypothetical protein
VQLGFQIAHLRLKRIEPGGNPLMLFHRLPFGIDSLLQHLYFFNVWLIQKIPVERPYKHYKARDG